MLTSSLNNDALCIGTDTILWQNAIPSLQKEKNKPKTTNAQNCIKFKREQKHL